MGEYKGLSRTEKQGFVKRIQEQEASKANEDPTPVRKLGSSATADVRVTVKVVHDSTNFLSEKSGYAIMSFGARSDFGQTAEPFELVPDVLHGFCEQVLKRTPARLAQEMEAFMLNREIDSREKKTMKTAALRTEVRELLRSSFGEFHAYNIYLFNNLTLHRDCCWNLSH